MNVYRNFLFALFALVSIASIPASSQVVRYYRAEASYDKDGVQHKHNGKMYLTFINNNQIIYRSDKNGNISKDPFGNSAMKYHYKGVRDGKLVYQAFWTPLYGHPSPRDLYMYFTQDFQRLNEVNEYYTRTLMNSNPYHIVVYNLSDPEDDVKAPQNFY